MSSSTKKETNIAPKTGTQPQEQKDLTGKPLQSSTQTSVKVQEQVKVTQKAKQSICSKYFPGACNKFKSFVPCIYKYYTTIPVQMSVYKSKYILDNASVNVRMIALGCTAIVVGFVSRKCRANLLHTFRNTAMSYFGFGFILAPEIFNPFIHFQQQQLQSLKQQITEDKPIKVNVTSVPETKQNQSQNIQQKDEKQCK